MTLNLWTFLGHPSVDLPTNSGIGCGIEFLGKKLGFQRAKMYCWEGQHLSGYG